MGVTCEDDDKAVINYLGYRCYLGSLYSVLTFIAKHVSRSLRQGQAHIDQ